MSSTVINLSRKWNLKWAFFFGIIIPISTFLPEIIYYWLISRQFGNNAQLNSYSHFFILVPVFLTTSFVVYLVMRSMSLSFFESIKFIGLKSPGFKQILTGLFLLTPLLGAFWLSYVTCVHENIPVTLYPEWKWNIIFVFVSAGIFEEIVYRGFLFQCLRKGRSFGFASFLSGLFWAAAHLNQLLTGNSDIQEILGVALVVFVLSFPSAYAFEKKRQHYLGLVVAARWV